MRACKQRKPTSPPPKLEKHSQAPEQRLRRGRKTTVQVAELAIQAQRAAGGCPHIRAAAAMERVEVRVLGASAYAAPLALHRCDDVDAARAALHENPTRQGIVALVGDGHAVEAIAITRAGAEPINAPSLKRTADGFSVEKRDAAALDRAGTEPRGAFEMRRARRRAWS